MFYDWRHCRNDVCYTDPIFADLYDLSTINPSDLCSAMCKFISEVKKFDGQDFPPKTLCDLVICVQLFLESQGLHFKFLDDPNFNDQKYTLDNLMKICTAASLGRNVHQDKVLEFEDEEMLWNRGFLGTDTSSKLVSMWNCMTCW